MTASPEFRNGAPHLLGATLAQAVLLTLTLNPNPNPNPKPKPKPNPNPNPNLNPTSTRDPNQAVLPHCAALRTISRGARSCC